MYQLGSFLDRLGMIVGVFGFVCVALALMSGSANAGTAAGVCILAGGGMMLIGSTMMKASQDQPPPR